ncbi:MAG: molybdopterin molybdotransferase, partial [Frankiaceae bacterium]|nr:molybdopterin molybdotransferase [Frankiaceae bacterium]
MKTVDEHLTTVLAGIGPLASLELTLLDAHGCVLAEDVAATHALPPFDNSAMD